MPKDTPSQVIKAEESTRLGKIKLAFLYTLIGGLVISAIISVVAILIGEFNDVVQKALATTFVIVLHSLLVLAIVSADKYNQLGKSLLSTTILATVVASIVTSTLGIWHLWADDASWKAFFIYLLVIGSAFIAAGIWKLRTAHKPTLALVYTSAGLLGLFTVALIPWIVLDATALTDLYFRVVAALTILGATALVVTVIVRRIAIAQDHNLLQTRPKAERISGGMLAVLITVGTFVAFAWMFGFAAFVFQSLQSTYDQNRTTYPRYEDRLYDDYR